MGKGYALAKVMHTDNKEVDDKVDFAKHSQSKPFIK